MKDAAMLQPSTSSPGTFQPLPLSLFLILQLNSRGRSLTEPVFSPHLPLGHKIHNDSDYSKRELYFTSKRTENSQKYFREMKDERDARMKIRGGTKLSNLFPHLSPVVLCADSLLQSAIALHQITRCSF